MILKQIKQLLDLQKPQLKIFVETTAEGAMIKSLNKFRNMLLRKCRLVRVIKKIWQISRVLKSQEIVSTTNPKKEISFPSALKIKFLIVRKLRKSQAAISKLLLMTLTEASTFRVYQKANNFVKKNQTTQLVHSDLNIILQRSLQMPAIESTKDNSLGSLNY